MFQFLNKPYPAPDYNLKHIWIAIGIGVFIALALIFLEPFGINHLNIEHKTAKLAGYGLVTFVVVFFFNVNLPKFLPRFFDDKIWVVYKEILFLLALLITIGLCNSLYSKVVLSDSQDLPGILSIIGQTFILGAIPVAFMVSMDHRRLVNKYEAQSKEIIPAQKMPIVETPVQPITLVGGNEGEKLALLPEQLLYLESNANYVSIVFDLNGAISKKLFRSSLSNMQNQLGSLDGILRCHRSYIVNLNRVKAVSGNAQGFRLDLPLLQDTIPVSRKYVNEIRIWFS